MIPLLAHHVETYHVPVLAALFAVGCWLGWHLVSKWQAGRTGVHEAAAEPPTRK